MALTDPRVALRNLAFSMIRTVVPMAVTWGVGVTTENFGPIINEDTKVQLVAGGYVAAATLYYFVARMLETYVTPKFAFLLGDFRKGLTAPVYPEETTTQVVPAAVTPALVVPPPPPPPAG